jgi:uncharacterized membrane protein
MENPVELVVASFREEERAGEGLDELKQLEKSESIGIVDVAVITKAKDGSLKVRETAEADGVWRGAGIGAIAGGVVGLLVGGPIGGIVLGTAAGALAGKAIDLGFSNKELAELGHVMGPGSSAVVAVIEQKSTADLCAVLEDRGAEIVCHPVEDEAARSIGLGTSPDSGAGQN